MSDRSHSDVVAEDTDAAEGERNPSRRGKWTSLVIAVLGLWLVVSPWLFEVSFGDAMGLNSVGVGALLALLGGYNYTRRAGRTVASTVVAVVVALLGLWLLVSPWVYAIDVDDPSAWNYVAVGLLVAALGLLSSYQAGTRDAEVAPTD